MRKNRMKYQYVLLLIAGLLSMPPCIFFRSLSTATGSPIALANAPLASEWNVVSAFDPNLLRLQAQSVIVNHRNGAVGFNKQGYISVGIQRHSSELITYGILTRNVHLIEIGIKILEYAFAHQKPDGSFLDNSPKQSAGSRASAVAFFYQDLGHSLLLCKDSDWFQKSKETANLRVRLNKLIEPAATSLTWLMGQQKALWKIDHQATNRLFFDAVGYYFVGKALGRSDAIRLGENWVRLALQQQTEAGFFLENGGYDSSYQGVSLRLALLLYTNLKPNAVTLRQELWTAINRGVRWQLTRILPTGQVSTAGNTRVYVGGEKYFGKEKVVDYKELILALNYYNKLSENLLVRTNADRVFSFFQFEHVNSGINPERLK